MNKNWPNDLRIGCKLFSNLVKLTEADAKFKKNLKSILKIWFIIFKNV
jgi:hypothetical protein